MTRLNPASGSVNPAASLSALWAYLEPALDHILKSPTNDPNGKAPAIDVGFYSGIHSACYNYFTSQNEAANLTSRTGNISITSGADIYDRLDKYFATAARELVLGMPHDDSDLIHYILPCFHRYSAGAQSIHRLLSYVNRHYVKRAVDEDRGWLCLGDILESVTKTITSEDTRAQISQKFRERKAEELKKWRVVDGESDEASVSAEACAEAASTPDRVVPILSLAHRRFRIEFIEPLLASPKIKANSKVKHRVPRNTGSGPPIPKGRLGRSVKHLLESQEFAEGDRITLVMELAMMLRAVGVRTDHPLRKKLDKFVSAC
ncbi:Cullin repeat-like-containing domain protein [Infundibulicybe gibba]|nr:Cullin repeat-like-containing domain protein [Infundibulicybe gibba]